MDSRRHSISNDGSRYPTYGQSGTYGTRRSVYKQATDPSQSFTRRSAAGAPVRADNIGPPDASYDKRSSAQRNSYFGAVAQEHGSVSSNRPLAQDADYFTPNIMDPAELPPPPDAVYGPTAVHREAYVTDDPPSRTRATPHGYPPQIQTQPNQYSDYSSYDGYDGSPVSPNTIARNAYGGSTSSPDKRRGSVPHKSPLQKLEGKLDDISKEEKRARLEEAEHQAQQRATAQRLNGSMYERPGDRNRIQNFSGKDAYASSKGQTGEVGTNPRDIRRSLEGVRKSPQENVQLQYDKRPMANDGTRDSSASQARRRDVPLYDTNYAAGLKERPPISDQKIDDSIADVQNSRAYQSNGKAASMMAANRGIQGTDRAAEKSISQTNAGSTEPTRNGSRRLQKKQPEGYSTGQRDPNTMSDAHKQLQNDRMGVHASSAVAAAFKHQEPDPVPREDVRTNSRHAPTYAIPPQTAAGQHARDQIGLHTKEQVPSNINPDTEKHHHFSSILHRQQGAVRRYETSRPLEEWKQAGTARLLGSDIDLEETKSADDRNRAWWEQGDSRRRSSYSHDDQYDGTQEDKDDRATFNPPLYLRCGPLLRYTGMRREQSSRSNRHARGEREIWRGSIMIVTSDAQSSYDRIPTLRLFVQPRDLLPPPPAQVDEVSGQHLAPEYVDPLAGLPKLSRTGKLIYVKPVEQLDEEVDYTFIEDGRGLFESVKRSQAINEDRSQNAQAAPSQRRRQRKQKDGESQGKYREVEAARLHAERGVTFWRFNLEIELGSEQARVAYRINRGPAIGFWVPARGQTMNMMFHSCNGFSLSVDPNHFSGPDPLWRDVLNNHQTRPFHVMIGGGDQIYNDRATKDTKLFQDWLTVKNPEHKHSAQFTVEMQDELEDFYLNRYAMWFSQGLFGMANSQIPMINIWDDHDIIDVRDYQLHLL